MGYMRHHAIIVTSWNEEKLFEVHVKARRIFGDELVSNIVESLINSYQSFFIAPDGSKEGWEDSDIGDTKREAFIKSLDHFRYEDGSTMFDWVEVQYGDDNRETKIIRHSDEEKYYRGQRDFDNHYEDLADHYDDVYDYIRYLERTGQKHQAHITRRIVEKEEEELKEWQRGGLAHPHEFIKRQKGEPE